jgi:uncharacterized RDD family membrane protein YckC
MSTPQAGAVAAPTGYLSEEAKRKFTLKAGILGAVFFILQGVLPIIVGMIMMPFVMMRGFGNIEEVDLRLVAWHQGAAWYTSRSMGFPPTPQRNGGDRLIRLVPGAEGDIRKDIELSASGGRPLAGGGSLWIVSAEEVASCSGGKLSVVDTEVLGNCTQPFVYKGRPAVYEATPLSTALKVLREEGWTEESGVPLPSITEQGFSPTDARPVAVGDKIHFFYSSGHTIYHWVDGGGWQAVAKATGYSWAALELDGAPVIVYLNREQVTARRLVNGTWEKFFEHRTAIASEVGACATGRPGELVVLVQGFPGSIRALTIQDGKVVNTTRHGGGFPFSGWFFMWPFLANVLGMLAPVLLAFILSRDMRRFRVCSYSDGPHGVRFASLWRRACAQMIDGAVLVGPLAVCWIVMMSGFVFEDMMFSPVVMLPTMLLSCGGMVWVFVGLFVFAAMEGSSGQSPGKRLMGIRVLGLDLRPIGFGRAFIRALLKFLDGFFGFMVGIMLVALTEKWQRIGDMAARSVVVMAGGRLPPARPPA